MGILTHGRPYGRLCVHIYSMMVHVIVCICSPHQQHETKSGIKYRQVKPLHWSLYSEVYIV